MTEDQLRKYKNIYLSLDVPDDIVVKKWELLAPLLPVQEKNKNYFKFMPYAFALSFFVVAFATAATVTNAKPGNPIYPIKALTQKFRTAISEKVNQGFGKIVVPSEIKKPSKADNHGETIITPTATLTPTPSQSVIKSGRPTVTQPVKRENANNGSVKGVDTQRNHGRDNTKDKESRKNQ